MDKMKEYLGNRESITDFSRRTGIAINTLRRIILEGKPCRRGTAKRIVKATKKEVTMKDFGYD